MRQAAPAKLKEIYAEKLVQLRPSADNLQADGGAEPAAKAVDGAAQGQENAGEQRDAPLTYSPKPQQLKEKLAGASSKLPVLRCAAALAGCSTLRSPK